MKHFQLSEFTRSKKAKELKIDNTPTELHKQHIEELVCSLLDPLREAWAIECANEHYGTPALYISSGYRGERLNEATPGASKTSAHCVGWAADLLPLNGRLLEFKRFARKWLEKRGGFDQMISESEDRNGTPEWVHIGLKARNGRQRGEFLSSPVWAKGGYIEMTR